MTKQEAKVIDIDSRRELILSVCTLMRKIQCILSFSLAGFIGMEMLLLLFLVRKR